MSFANRVGARGENAWAVASRWLGPISPLVPRASDGARAREQGSGADHAWVALVGGADAILRRWNGVYEFSDNADCVLRVGLERACAQVVLPSGVVVPHGAPIGVLHFWNEHLPPFPPGGPDISWAKTMEQRFRFSFGALAAHAEANPDWARVRALRCIPALSGQLRPAQMRRVANRYGFEMATFSPAGLSSLHTRGEDVLLWAFARAFNPAALKRHRFHRARTELWMSRETLRSRFLRPAGTD